MRGTKEQLNKKEGGVNFTHKNGEVSQSLLCSGEGLDLGFPILATLFFSWLMALLDPLL